MTSPAKAVTPIEDLVKTAIKEAIAKRTGLEEATKASEELTPADVVAATEVAVSSASIVCESGQMLMSALFDGVLTVTKNKDFPVTVFGETHFHESMREFIPAVDPTYELQKEHVYNILKAWESKEKILVYGPTGAGKSSLIQQLCAHTRRPFIRVNSTGDMDSSMIFGNQVARDGATHWVDGVVTECVRHGGVFAWDEWDVTPPEIGMGLQWLLEDKGKLFLKEMPGTNKEKFITPHTDFRIVALGNTRGQGDDTGAHAGTNVQNTATLDRFTTVLCVDYLEESVEVRMLTKQFPSMVKDALHRLVQFATLVRQAYLTNTLALTLSPRALLSICKKITSGYTAIEALQLVYYNKLPDTHEKVAKELFRKVFGSTK